MDVRAQIETGFAVVELFTSQGCSSCPSADRVLSKIVNNAGDRPIYALSFHVDYWDYLGWKDPYSTRVFTNRQRSYAAALRSTSIYTPQMIVNGEEELVGSNEAKANELIDAAIHDNRGHQLKFVFQQKGSALFIDYRLSGETTDKVINIALVERNITTSVTRGENRNRTLTHDNVVRSFLQVPAGISGEVKLPVPDDLVSENASVIIYVQDNSTYEITGATSMSF